MRLKHSQYMRFGKCIFEEVED
ncbi:MAG: hypothetical protein EGR83_18960 [Bacteroides cellulosilyticus]|nr:hypothetical protein [Bacteroides cellulosilyticus]